MPRPVLVDRDDDLGAVDAAVDRAVGGSGSLLVFTGPLGIGRTALLDECARRGTARGVRVLRARGTDDERGVPLSTARRLLAVAPTDLPGRAAHGDFEALHAELAAHAADGPVLLLVDDASRCDADSLRWFAFLGHRLAGLRVTIVLTALDGDGGHDGGAGPVPADLVGQAGAVRPLRPLSDGAVVVAALAEATGGNPLFLAAVVEEVAAGPHGCQETLAHRVRECAPARLRDRLARAVRRMPEPERRYLTAVAAAGDVTDDTMLGRLAGLDATDTAAAGSVARRMGLTGPAEHRLRHRVVGDALDVVQSSGQRRDTHLRAAELLRDFGGSSDRVALHLLAVGGAGLGDRRAARGRGSRRRPRRAVDRDPLPAARAARRAGRGRAGPRARRPGGSGAVPGRRARPAPGRPGGAVARAGA
ncbi:regulatory protein, LuxR [Pseudonocardia sp. Ae168_Ps1]|uniref:AAA family ATPase n=1 Tax=unclassified Pseudonocardia TaxID=2619320 RepID=UPI00094AC382|nr:MULTISPECIES: AAA family ATPase [unclassified Pseudonocardia]OLL71689.1 regulatory protein, LuxR [Pseudonocardia sp. Ae150A_Ps1]OLL77664.1 regulatory protein, LuxR [Pseudonocardia sp. Ae168_Ps1]OLL88213.1 regulatory protein, LuxR [Pseudonocardia sp. Ae263_Ps1]OLL91757.1 regulatory protein, LuxR [Pseudonocardia sp. Ae356_Ps1]